MVVLNVDFVEALVRTYRAGFFPHAEPIRGPVEKHWPKWTQDEKYDHIAYLAERISLYGRQDRYAGMCATLASLQNYLIVLGHITVEEAQAHISPPPSGPEPDSIPAH
jgi:hypothetical protein